ncbi:TetR/AcrR family transcriptional regulator [Thalassospira indica]|uniref:TetR/AcrR family transcriptional regulator n=1 Tax=Thalassospira indica TaxID=1891279 RepID=A0ABM6XVY1_9PROT|nr:TetR/AcrR family transcriptional regulator [Thalassospira indica]AXO13857.1 TetR/AcrR family transcriptional regulator [Thalassospira indica]OAZ14252.1 TetR family transcriptional regulator [Thalassospira profundimaris]
MEEQIENTAGQTSSGQNSGWRGSAEIWLNAAYDALIETGVDGVKIQPLAKRLSLSRTSFYWFFKDRKELLGALLDLWREKNTGNLIKQTEAYAETVSEAMLNIIDCWLMPDLFDSRLEFAVRSWSMQSDDVRAEIEKADQQRLDALAKLFIHFGQEERMADVRARAIYLVQIGYISMKANEDLAVRMARIPGYVETFCGQASTQSELNRFYARHSFVP